MVYCIAFSSWRWGEVRCVCVWWEPKFHGRPGDQIWFGSVDSAAYSVQITSELSVYIKSDLYGSDLICMDLICIDAQLVRSENSGISFCIWCELCIVVEELVSKHFTVWFYTGYIPCTWQTNRARDLKAIFSSLKKTVSVSDVLSHVWVICGNLPSRLSRQGLKWNPIGGLCHQL